MKQTYKKIIEVENAVAVDVSFSSSSVTLKGIDPHEGFEFSFNVSNYKTEFYNDVMSRWDLKQLVVAWRERDRDNFDDYVAELQAKDQQDEDDKI